MAITTIKKSTAEIFGITTKRDIDVAKEGHPLIPQTDPNYVFRGSLVMKLLLWFYSGTIPGFGQYIRKGLYLHGPTGTGKSSLVEQFASRLNVPVFTLQGSEELVDMDLYGSLVPSRDGGVEFKDGALTQSIRLSYERPVIFLVDEGDLFRPGTFSSFNAINEGRAIIIPQTGEEIKPHPANWRIAVTANTVGDGGSGEYAATKIQNVASLKRFEPLAVDYPQPAIEENIYKKMFPFIPDEQVKSIVRLVNNIREAYAKGELPAPVGVREMAATLAATAIYGDLSTKVSTYLQTKAKKDQAFSKWKTAAISPFALAITGHLCGPPYDDRACQIVSSLARDIFGGDGWEYPVNPQIVEALDVVNLV